MTGTSSLESIFFDALEKLLCEEYAERVSRYQEELCPQTRQLTQPVRRVLPHPAL